VSTSNWKELIDSSLHKQAQSALDNCDFFEFLIKASNEVSLPLLATVVNKALACGELESAFINAFTRTRTNNHSHSQTIECLLQRIDPIKLKSVGDKIPSQDEFRLYRGVSGNDSSRTINGYSWTSNLELAHWFAMRYSELGNPSIFTTTVCEDAVLFCPNERDEHEFVLNPKVIKADFLGYGDQDIADKHEKYLNQKNSAKLAEFRKKT
jgi:hypothetical protein